MSVHSLPDECPARGKITSGLEANTLTKRTVEFVLNELPKWRDDLNRQPEEAEERLNAQLCKFLEVAARRSLKMVFFHHEEKQTGIRRVDLSALPTSEMFIGSTFHTIYEPFLVFEGKRLPAPKGQPNREQEYVTGGKDASGGVQRFKLGLHGAKLELAVIIGYVQEGEIDEWVDKINSWITNLSTSASADGLKWAEGEKLRQFSEDVGRKIGSAFSAHPRIGSATTSAISLHHLLVKMQIKP